MSGARHPPEPGLSCLSVPPGDLVTSTQRLRLHPRNGKDHRTCGAGGRRDRRKAEPATRAPHCGLSRKEEVLPRKMDSTAGQRTFCTAAAPWEARSCPGLRHCSPCSTPPAAPVLLGVFLLPLPASAPSSFRLARSHCFQKSTPTAIPAPSTRCPTPGLQPPSLQRMCPLAAVGLPGPWVKLAFRGGGRLHTHTHTAEECQHHNHNVNKGVNLKEKFP